MISLYDIKRKTVTKDSDGIPSTTELEGIVRRVKQHVSVHRLDGYQYVLSTRQTAEMLIIGE